MKCNGFDLFLVSLLVLNTTACRDASEQQSKIGDAQVNAQISVPSLLLESRTIQVANIFPVLRIDNDEYDFDDDDGDGVWSVSVDVNPDETYSLFLDWYENFQNRELMLATSQQQIRIEQGSNTAYFGATQYTLPDADGDGISNFEERGRFDTASTSNPYVPEDVEDLVDVIIPRVPEGANSPSIDGNYSASEWQYAVGGEGQLKIDKKLFQESSTTNDIFDGNAGQRWQAVHDGNYLYFIVFADDTSHVSDSSDHWDDDNLNLYLDPDYSHSSQYDDLNDIHYLITLFGEDRTSLNNGSRVGQGVNSIPVVSDMQVATALNEGPSGRGSNGPMDVYEVRFNISQIGIQIGRRFGMDVHLDDDDDNGERDSKWSWFLEQRSPNVSDTENDLSYQRTDVLSAAVLSY